MAYKLYGNMRFIPRNDTLENWETENPVLGPGEWGAVIGVDEAGDELDTVERIKVGDGVTPWNDLPWWTGPQGPKGDKGDKGDIGEQGPKGDKGDKGAIKFIPVIEFPTESIESDAIYLLPSNNPKEKNIFDEYIYDNGKWECIGSTGVEVNLDEYVKKDYVDNGFVKYKETYGVMKVYGNDTNGTQKLFTIRQAGQAVKGSHIPQTDTNGILHAMTPTAEAENTALINKEYAESNLMIKPKTPVRTSVVSMGGDGKINTTSIVHESATGWSMPCRDGYGCIKVATPITDLDAANKKYVDDAISNGLTALAIPNVITDCGKSLTVNDVSPLAHKCSLQLTSDTYEEITGDSRNIFNPTNDNTDIMLNKVINEDGSISISGYGSGSAVFYLKNLTPNKIYTISLRSSNIDVFDPLTTELNLMPFSDEERNEGIVGDFQYIYDNKATFTWKESYKVVMVAWGSWGISDDVGEYELTLYPQLEEGSEMTEWQPSGGGAKPYIEDFSTVKVNVGDAFYTPNVYGMVTDIVSVSPVMEVTTDNEYANITNFTYLVDTKKYIDNNSSGGAALGDIETALDNIIAIQENLIGGDV